MVMTSGDALLVAVIACAASVLTPRVAHVLAPASDTVIMGADGSSLISPFADRRSMIALLIFSDPSANARSL